MKVNLIVNSFPAPSETFLFNLVVGLESKGANVTIVAAKKSEHNNLYKTRINEWSGKIVFMPHLSILNIGIFIFKTIQSLPIFISLLKRTSLKKAIYQSVVYGIIMQNKPDIVHFSYSGIAVQFKDLIPHINKDAKTMASCRGTGEKLKPIIEIGRKGKLCNTLNIVDAIHCVSNDMKNVIQQLGVNNPNILVNPPAISSKLFCFKKRQLKTEDELFNIVTVGRLSFEKGYNYALHACKLLKNSGFKFKYHILGDGPDKCILQYIINDLGLLNDVELYGKVNGDKVNQILQQSDIFLLPSIYEGISNAALEAMASGVPIISTDAGGMEEVIEDGVNGRIVKRYNSIELYNALTWMILNYGKSIIMADEAVITIKNNHTHDNQISKYLNYYETLLL